VDGIHVVTLGLDDNQASEKGSSPRLPSDSMDSLSEVTIWLSTPLWARDPQTEEVYQSNRHVVRAERVIQDTGTTQVIDASGEVLLEFPTKYVERCTWIPIVHEATSTRDVVSPPTVTSGLPVGSKSWRDAVTEENPRAYEPWSDKEDDELREEIRRSLSYAEIARAHQRRVGAIAARVKKLGLA